MPRQLSFPDAVPNLDGELVYLREITEEDIPAWYARATDAESAALAGDPIPESIELGNKWLARIRDGFHEQTNIRWAIVLKGAKQSIGSIGFAINSKEDGFAELGAVIGRSFWSNGIGTSAAKVVIEYGFGGLGLTQIRAELLQSNGASIRVLEKLGFQRAGIIPDFEQSDARSEDGYLYVLTRSSVD